MADCALDVGVTHVRLLTHGARVATARTPRVLRDALLGCVPPTDAERLAEVLARCLAPLFAELLLPPAAARVVVCESLFPPPLLRVAIAGALGCAQLNAAAPMSVPHALAAAAACGRGGTALVVDVGARGSRIVPVVLGHVLDVAAREALGGADAQHALAARLLLAAVGHAISGRGPPMCGGDDDHPVAAWVDAALRKSGELVDGSSSNSSSILHVDNCGCCALLHVPPLLAASLGVSPPPPASLAPGTRPTASPLPTPTVRIPLNAWLACASGAVLVDAAAEALVLDVVDALLLQRRGASSTSSAACLPPLPSFRASMTPHTPLSPTPLMSAIAESLLLSPLEHRPQLVSPLVLTGGGPSATRAFHMHLARAVGMLTRSIGEGSSSPVPRHPPMHFALLAPLVPLLEQPPPPFQEHGAMVGALALAMLRDV